MTGREGLLSRPLFKLLKIKNFLFAHPSINQNYDRKNSA